MACMQIQAVKIEVHIKIGLEFSQKSPKPIVGKKDLSLEG